MKLRIRGSAPPLFFLLLAASGTSQSITGRTQVGPQAPDSTTGPPDLIRIAVLGDYGDDGPELSDVADLVKNTLRPRFIATVGDNNYPDGEASTMDVNVGKHFHEYIGNYQGLFGEGSARNRFFPSLGNHDWHTPGAIPYLDYFTLPGNERYYEVVKGPVHMFFLDSDSDEPDGITESSVQGNWLMNALASSTAPFRFVFLHHAPFSSSQHGNDTDLQWPFAAWGATAVFAGHDHVYERIERPGLPYFVNGLGGRSIYAFENLTAGSNVQFNADYGAMYIEATAELATVWFVDRGGTVIDMHSFTPDVDATPEEELLNLDASWRYLDDGSDQGTAWRAPAFDDSSWTIGDGQFGYGDGDEDTVVDFGPNPNNKYATTYFRTTFDVPNPSLYESVSVNVLRDDGVVAFLNGVELFRHNMGVGVIDFQTFASVAQSGSEEENLFSFDLPVGLLTPGTNHLAVEVHQSSGTSSDLGFQLEVIGTRNVSPLVPAGAIWSYLDNGTDPGATWIDPSFDDSGWSSGPAQLGYGEGDEATVVSFGPNPDDRYVTTYFRTDFNVVDPSAFRSLHMHLLRDDAAACYLNGVEVHRNNLPYGSFDTNTLASYPISGPAETAFTLIGIDPSLLVAGNNVLAVEIHQRSPASVDLSFDLALIGHP